MMQPELLHTGPSWPFCDVGNLTFDALGTYEPRFGFQGLECEIPSPFTTSLDSHVGGASSSYCGLSDVCNSMELRAFSAFNEASAVVCPLVDDFSVDFEGLEAILNDETGHARDLCLEMSDASFSSTKIKADAWSPGTSFGSEESDSMSMSSARQLSLTLPSEDMEIDKLVSLHHLLKAYGEAVDHEQNALMEVISKCIAEKSDPLGETLERLGFCLCQSLEDQRWSLKHESNKNFGAAFMAFYQMFPYGKFAHFAANSAIIEAIPSDVDIIHVVDFDMGEGIQWHPLIEAVRWRIKALKLTSVTVKEQGDRTQSEWNFEDTKRRLYDHAMSIGVKLTVETVTMEELAHELSQKDEDSNKDLTAFNCITGLPHAGRVTSTRVNDFLRLAKDFLGHLANRFNRSRGIVTHGDGNPFENLRNCSGRGEFFEGCLKHYHLLLQSIQSDFPAQLAEARMAMESLFIGPFISFLPWSQKWAEIRNGSIKSTSRDLHPLPISKRTLMEAQEMLKGKTSYEVKIGGKGNEMILEWRGNTLVRFFTWECMPRRR